MNAIYKNAMTSLPVRAVTDKCIVLDLDETLVHTCNNFETLKELKIMDDPDLMDLKQRSYVITMDDVVTKKGTGVKTTMWGIVRPHVKEFLISCFAYFKVVIVWSAGKRKYVDAIVDFLFKDIKRPHVVYSYDECERTNNGLLTKPLMKLIKNEPGLSKYMSLNNSLIIDDRDTVYNNDNPYNGIQIPPYRPAFNIHSLRSDDIRLKQLMTWLFKPEVMESEDVRTLDKNKVFETPVTSVDIRSSDHKKKISTLRPIMVN